MSYSGKVFVSPVDTSFTTLNAVAGTVIENVANSTVLYSPDINISSEVIGQYIAAPTAPYCTIMNISSNPGDYCSTTYSGDEQTILYGCGFYDGTKLLFMTMNWCGSTTNSYQDTMGMNIYEMTNVSTLGSNVYGQRFTTGYPSASVNWMQIQDDGTNLTFYIATDAGPAQQPTHWVKLYSQARTSYLSSPTNVFWGMMIGGTSSCVPYYSTLNSWQIIPL